MVKVRANKLALNHLLNEYTLIGHLGTFNMARENSAKIEGQAVVSDLADEDVMINFGLQNMIAKSAVNQLLKLGFYSLEALSQVVMDDLVSPKIPVGQHRLILHIAGSLNISHQQFN